MVIIFSEIIPKTIGEKHAEKTSLLVARPVMVITRLFTPLIWLIEKITSPFTKGKVGLTTNEEEIRLLAKIGQKQGVIENDESEMIQKVFLLNDKKAFDLMTPRITMTYLKSDQTLKEAKDQIINSQHSRILVIKEVRDNIIGVTFKNELLLAIIEKKENEKVSNFIHQVQFVPESEKADKLLLRFQKSRQHIAVVEGDYGGVSGIITLEDVLEVITGEIVDETDRVVDLQELAKEQRKNIP